MSRMPLPIETLDQCARHLARLRPAYPKGTQHHISNLIQQIKNYPLNPDALRPAILRSIERIEGCRITEPAKS